MNAVKTAKTKTTAPSAASAPKTAVAGQPRGRYDDILALQRAAGNHAVSGLFLASRGTPRTVSQKMLSVVQRALDVNEGGPLDLHTKAEMEDRFGQDLNDVRVHTDPIAADSARAIGARAYTVGRHVVFAPAHYAPRTIAGRALLAHELVHVLQQRGGRAAASTAAATGNLTARWEAQADQAGHHMSDPSPALYSNGPSPYGPIASNLKPAPTGILQCQFAEGPAIDPAYADIALAIQGGWRMIAALDEPTLRRATVDQRVTMLTQLAAAYRTGSSEEEAIIRILSTTPSSDAPALIARLDAPLATGKCLFDELDRVVDFGNNLDLHTEISQLRLRAMPPSKGIEALHTAPVLPWHDDVMGFFEDNATFQFWLTEKGKIRIRYSQGIKLLSSTDFADEIRQLPKDLFYYRGFDFDPDQLLMIHDYDREQSVPVMARDLLGYRHAGIRNFLAHMVRAASAALPAGSAKTVIGKVAVIAFERVLPIASTIINENRLNIIRWFPTWGRRMLYFNDLVQRGVELYGIVQFARAGARIIKSWREVRNARAALEGAASDAKAEAIARQLEQQADTITEELEKIREGEEAAARQRPPARPSPPAEALEATVAPHGPALAETQRSVPPTSPIRVETARSTEPAAPAATPATTSSSGVEGAERNGLELGLSGGRGGGKDALALLEGGGETGGFQGEGPLVRVPTTKEGTPTRILELAAGTKETNLSLPPERELVAVHRTDINRPLGPEYFDARKAPPAHMQGKYDTLIINNPRGFKPNIAEIGRALRPGGRIIIQGRAKPANAIKTAYDKAVIIVEGKRQKVRFNGDFQEILDSPTPSGYKRVYDEEVPPPPFEQPTSRSEIMGGPFHTTSGQGHGPEPNARIIYEKNRE